MQHTASSPPPPVPTPIPTPSLSSTQLAAFDAAYDVLRSTVYGGSFFASNWITILPILMRTVQANKTLSGTDRRAVVLHLFSRFISELSSLTATEKSIILALVPTVGAAALEVLYRAGCGFYGEFLSGDGGSRCRLWWCAGAAGRACSSSRSRATASIARTFARDRDVPTPAWWVDALPKAMAEAQKYPGLTGAQKKEVVVATMLQFVPPTADVALIMGQMCDLTFDAARGRLGGVGSVAKRSRSLSLPLPM